MARSLADRMRQHREEFELALQMHCTPAEARAELDRRAARRRWEETSQRLSRAVARRDCATAKMTAAADWSAAWMLRD